MQKYDCIVIGGGFFGSYISLLLKNKYKNILLLEQEDDILLRASINNQARVHNGYHYPRSISTAVSSARHFKRFCNDFSFAIKNDFEKYYAIARIGSKTNAIQFYRFFKQFNIEIELAQNYIKSFFDDSLISDVFCVREYAFNANVLREIMQDRLHNAKIQILFNTKAIKIYETKNGIILQVESNGQIEKIESKLVFNCTYSGINTLLQNSNLPLLPLKHEVTEMSLVSMPNTLKNISITIMDGSFFSLMPYPSKGELYTLSHVRYTPHYSWEDRVKFHNPYNILKNFKSNPMSNFPLMIADAKRYMPILKDCIYMDSIYEIKTLQTKNEIDDGRPILFAKDHGIKGFSNIMGGKIDNIYEIIDLLYNEFL